MTKNNDDNKKPIRPAPPPSNQDKGVVKPPPPPPPLAKAENKQPIVAEKPNTQPVDLMAAIRNHGGIKKLNKVDQSEQQHNKPSVGSSSRWNKKRTTNLNRIIMLLKSQEWT
ncbi:MAG: hypothetical protein RCG15_03520 [Candidatus Rickettsia vulgarisii]